MPHLTCPVCGTRFKRKQCYLNKLQTDQPTCSNLCRSAFHRMKAAQITEKPCTKCDVIKPLEEFYNAKDTADGKSSACKDCVRDQIYEGRKKNPERFKEVQKRYYANNREKRLRYHREYYANNREDVLQQTYEFRAKHPERVKRQRRKYYRRHSKEIKAKISQHYRTHRDEASACAKRRRQRPEVHRQVLVHNRLRKARRRELPNDFTETDWQFALSYWDGCCAICGKPNGLWHDIVMDHWIPLNNPDCPGTIPTNIVPLCHGIDGCNNSKCDKLPDQWLTEKFGAKKAKRKLNEIKAFFSQVRS